MNEKKNVKRPPPIKIKFLTMLTSPYGAFLYIKTYIMSEISSQRHGRAFQLWKYRFKEQWFHKSHIRITNPVNLQNERIQERKLYAN